MSLNKARMLPIAVLLLLAAPALAATQEKIVPIPLRGAVEGFTTKTIDGKTFDLKKDAAGRAVLLVVWTPDFAPSLAALKEVRDFMAKYPRKSEVLVLGVIRGADDREISKARGLLKDNDIPFLTAIDPKFDLIQRLSVFQAPSFLLIDKSGFLATRPVPAFNEPIFNMKFTDFIPLTLDGKPIPATEFVFDPGRRLLNEAAPAFTLPDLSGRDVSLAGYKNKKSVALILWSPSCPHCRRELPRLEKYYKGRGEKRDFELIAVFGVKDKTSVDSAKAFVKEQSITYPVLVDKDLKVFKEYNSQAVPYVFFIDKNGVIRETMSGEHENLETLYDQVLKKMDK